MKRCLTARKKKLYSVAVLFLTVAVLIVCDLIWKSAQNIICEIAENESVTVVSKAVDRYSSELCYDDVFQISYDSQKKVSSVNLNTKRINTLKAELSSKIVEMLESGNLKVKVYSWDLSSSLFLLGKGIPINVKLDSYSAYIGDIYSEIISGGINQTLYKVYAKAEIKYNLILPRNENIAVTVTKQIPVAETLIVGEVPSYLR